MSEPTPREQKPIEQPLVKEQADPEAYEQIEALWNDPEIVSYSLRRHGNYERDRTSTMRGSLTPESIQEVKAHAQDWVTRLPGQTEVEIYQSPSFMPVKRTDQKTGEEKTIRPMRATITASLYEKAVFGDLKAVRTESGEVVSARRVTEPRLGDFLESSTDAEGIGHFYDVLGETYKGLTSEFWDDYTHDTLDPKVAEAIKDCSGTDSMGLAKNVATFIEDTHAKASTAQDSKNKHAVLAVTHGESMRSFTYFIGKYLEHTKTANEATVDAFRNQDFSYNEGVDIHVTPDEVTIVVANKHAAALKLEDFKQYLHGLREEKESHAAEIIS